jgi:succinate dehydrogenase / fumarate reductase cytochrome b subunit
MKQLKARSIKKEVKCQGLHQGYLKLDMTYNFRHKWKAFARMIFRKENGDLMKGNSYLPRKLHSLLGVVPLCLFMIEHALTNFSIVEKGPEGFRAAVAFLKALPVLPVLEVVLILLPLLYHAGYGIYMAFQSGYKTSMNYGRNWAFIWQRITGLITVVFVVWHLWQIRFQVALGVVDDVNVGVLMSEIANNPLFFVLYIIGSTAAVYHFSNGLWAFCVSWGITVGPRAQKISLYICSGLFFIVAAMFIAALVMFRTTDFPAVEATLTYLSALM